MKLIRIILLSFVVFISACKPPEATWTVDQCLRNDLFQQCLKLLPAGPHSTQYNDWDEVVGKCESSAYYQSIRSKEVVKKECRSSP